VKRLFQHYSGEVNALAGLELKSLQLFVDSHNEEDIILMWVETEMGWLRIFIDGAYCGIDIYETDRSIDDWDDGVTCISRNNLVCGKRIQKAIVTSAVLPEIQFSIYFEGGSFLHLKCDQNEICRLRWK